MAVALKIKYPDTNISVYKEARAALGLTDTHDGVGLLFHWVEETEGGFIVRDVWESREQFDSFVEQRLAPIAESVGMPEGEVEEAQVYDYLAPSS